MLQEVTNQGLFKNKRNNKLGIKMQITAAMVKELRERTGAGMMDCKKALTEAGGDIDAAIGDMRKSGVAKAAKKAGRVAAEGVILIKAGENAATVVEINSETDFVAKDENFIGFANAVAEIILEQAPVDIEALKGLTLEGGSVEDARLQLVSKIGENISVRRFQTINVETGQLGAYSHGGRIGVLLELEGGDATLAKDVAMHIAASHPLCISEDQVPAEILEKEKEIFSAQARESGKPENIIEKMITGRVNKFLKETTLLGQPFVKDPDQSVEKLLKSKNASIKSFIRFEVGEGIEKKKDNFAEEVIAQAGLNKQTTL